MLQGFELIDWENNKILIWIVRSNLKKQQIPLKSTSITKCFIFKNFKITTDRKIGIIVSWK